MIIVPIGITEVVEDEEGFYVSSVHILFRNSVNSLWNHRYWDIHGMTKKETKENIAQQLESLKDEIKIRKKECPQIEFKMIPELKIKRIEV